MKKLSLLICFVSALFLVTSCNFTLNPTTSQPEQTTPDNQETPDTPSFEYTAENDIPAEQAPFDARYCYENATELNFSDGAWTLVMSNIIPDMFNEKFISKATASNNTLTINSGILKIDIPFNEEEDSEEALPDSDESFESVFNEIKAMWIEAGVEDAANFTFINGYLTESKKVVLIIDATEYNEQFFSLAIQNGTIKSNPAKTKYVITVTSNNGNISIPFYIYKNANLTDAETIPEDTGNSDDSPTEGPEESGNNDSGNSGSGSSETIPLTQLYTAENDIPSATPPFDPALCTEANATLTFTNGNWKIVDIAEGTICNDKTISAVSYNNGEFNCSSVISKVDFPRNGTQEEDVNYDSFYSQLKSKYNVRLSHGYVTDDKIVLIVEEDTALFEEVYKKQLTLVSGKPYVISNASKTKFVIAYTGNGYLQYIYVYKENAEEDLGYTVPELPANVGTDPFKGKTFGETTEKYVFGNDKTITYYGDLSNQTSLESDVQAQFKYQYTYDADTKLLTYRCVMMLDPTTVKLATFNEIKANLSKLTSGAQNPEELYDYYVSSLTELFETPKVWKAELSDGKLSVYDPYYTEVPDLTKTNLQLRTSFNNTTVEIFVSQYDKSTITIVIPVDYTDDKGVLHSNSSSIKTEYEITSLTENTITAIEKEKMKRNNEENGDYYSVVNQNPATITIEYKNAKAKDGLIYIDISGKDDITKQALGADEKNPDPSYTVISTNDQPHTYPLMN